MSNVNRCRGWIPIDAVFTQILRLGHGGVAVHHSGGFLFRGEIEHGRRIGAVDLVGVSVRLWDAAVLRELSAGVNHGGLAHHRTDRSRRKGEVTVLSWIGRVVEAGIELGVPVVPGNLPHLLLVVKCKLLLLLLQSLLLFLQVLLL